MGGTVGLAVGQAAFASELGGRIGALGPAAPINVIRESPLAIYSSVSPELIPAVVKGYVQALDIGSLLPPVSESVWLIIVFSSVVFILGVPFAILGLVLAFFIKNISIKKPATGGPSTVEAKSKDQVERSEKNMVELEGEEQEKPSASSISAAEDRV